MTASVDFFGAPIATAAKTAHEVNRAYCASIGDGTQLRWEEAPAWQVESCVAGVEAIVKNPDITPEQSHEGWLARKKEEGWIYGEKKDVEKKTHPCMVPYADLPSEQRAKDRLFCAVVRSVLRLR